MSVGEWLQIAAVIISIIGAVLSGRAASWGKAAGLFAKTLDKIVGKPDPQHARPTTGETLSEKVEFLGDAQLHVVNNQFLIAQSLRAIADELAAIQGHGKRRLPTDSIPLPKDFSNGE